MEKEITVTAEQIEKLIEFAKKQEEQAEGYYVSGRDSAARWREGVSMGIYHALSTIGVEID